MKRRPGSSHRKKGAATPVRRRIPRGLVTTDAPGCAVTATGGRKGKYNAGGEHVEGVWMASAAQAVRYRQLLKMLREERICNLRTEVPFPLIVNNVKVATYRADFVYNLDMGRGREGKEIVEEVKGMETPEWKLKKRLFEALEQRPIAVIIKPKKWPDEYEPQLRGRKSLRGWIEVYWKDRLPE